MLSFMTVGEGFLSEGFVGSSPDLKEQRAFSATRVW